MPAFSLSVIDAVLGTSAAAFRAIDEAGAHGTTPFNGCVGWALRVLTLRIDCMYGSVAYVLI
jgi:hypothetical protein